MRRLKILSHFLGNWVGHVGLIWLAFLSNANSAVIQGEVALYGLYETTIDYKALAGQAHSYANPFYGVELKATFTSPSGRQVAWWGFYDGDGRGGQTGNIWKLRFMPDELGKWTYTWNFSEGNLKGNGSFQAVDSQVLPRKPGPLKRDSAINQWFVTADGSRHIFLNMYHNSNYPFEYYDNPRNAIGTMKNYGFDVIFTSGGAHRVWRDRPKNSTNPYQFIDTVNYVPRLQGWHFMENGIFLEAYKQEVYLYEFLGFYAGNQMLNLHTKSETLQRQVLRYWLARTAPYYIFLYNIGFELAEYVNTPGWPVNRAQFIKDINPWKHPVTGHELGGWSYGNSNVIDFSALQSNDNFHQRALAVWNSSSKPHPHCNECIWNFLSYQSQGTETSHRKDLWDGITAGMSYAFLALDNNTGLTAFRHANAFLKSGVKWWTMAPHDKLKLSGTAYVLANPGVEYIVYSSTGNSFSLDLPAGHYQRRWFDPATGMWISPQALTQTLSGSAMFTKPSSNDWVLHLITSSVPPPHSTSITSPAQGATFTPGQTVTGVGSGANLSWDIDLIGDGLASFKRGFGSNITFTVPSTANSSQLVRIILSGDGGSVTRDHNIVASPVPPSPTPPSAPSLLQVK